MTLGEKLSRLRRENNYTQEKLADILGVSRQAISKWESDVAYPETDKLIRLSALFHCSLDYLVREDIQEIEVSKKSTLFRYNPEKVNSLLRGVIRFAPIVLYSLWALLLWAMYSTPLINLTDKNLYQWFGNYIVYELQPAIRALIALGVISGAYIVPLFVLQRYAGKRVNLFANIGSFIFEIAIFTCALCLIEACKSCGFESGSVVLAVAIVTGVVILLQAGLTALKLYYDKVTRQRNDKAKANYFEKLKSWFKLHKLVAIVLACVLVVGVTLSTVLPLTVGKFSTATVSRIIMGDNREKVTRILGKPFVRTDELTDIVGSELVGKETNEDECFYFSPNAEKIINSILRTEDMENSNSLSFSDMLLLYIKRNNLKKQLDEMQFKYIKINFESNDSTSWVNSIEFNAAYTAHMEQKIKWNVRGKRKQKIKFSPKEIAYGSTPSVKYSLRAQVFYSDGSYRMSYVENPYVQGGANAGWTVTWADNWGIYTQTIQQNKKPTGAVDYGDVSEDVSFHLSKVRLGSAEWYTMVIFGKGENGYGKMENLAQYPWSKYADKLREVYVVNGVTNIPDNAFKGMVDLRYVRLPSSVTTIGSNIFSGCTRMKVVMDSSLTEIPPYAFADCTIISTSELKGLYGDWTVSLSHDDVGEKITIDNIYTLLDYLSNTYCEYYWRR